MTEAENVVVATPERVSFSYETAGLGSRSVAQVIDLSVLVGLLVALGAVALAIGVLTQEATFPTLVLLVFGFAIFWGYFIVSEALWSGQTLGKRALGLRAVDVRGGPISLGQSIVRNLVRIVDFLPAYYGLGAVVVFATIRNQRLGDLAAGTVVVRERQSISLEHLTAVTASAPDVALPELRRGRRLDAPLRRFVVAYAARRAQLAPERRAELAARAEPALRRVLPDVVTRHGALAALEQLADDVGPNQPA